MKEIYTIVATNVIDSHGEIIDYILQNSWNEYYYLNKKSVKKTINGTTVYILKSGLALYPLYKNNKIVAFETR